MRPMSATVRAVLAHADEWVAWNRANAVARRYYIDQGHAPEDYARRAANSEATLRYRRRKRKADA